MHFHVGLSVTSSCRMPSPSGVKVPPGLAVLAVLLSLLSSAWGFSECGDYYYIGPGTTGVINSPDYPAMYPTYSKCIWLIHASSAEYRVRLTLTYTGERYNGTCADYVEIRDGGQYAPLLGTYCDSVTNEVITSGHVWMWILFKSDGITGSATVMTATFSSYYNATPSDNTTKPYSDCRSYEFECRNKMCASLSYRCDGYNDCGCKDECDEDECYTLSITKGVQIGISVAVGVVTFLLVSLTSFLIEGQHSWTSTLAEANRERETREEARRRRVSKAFSKFIGGSENNFANSNINKNLNSCRNNAIKGPPPPANSNLKGPLNTLTVPPSNAPAFRLSDMAVTDIEA